MKKFLFSFYLLYSSIFGQPGDQPASFLPKLPFESEVIAIPRVDGDYSVYFSYKIPYKLLVFERDEEAYNAGFRIIVEIDDMNSNLVFRDIKDSEVSVDNFESTNEHTLFLQDYLEFKLKPGEYNIVSIISDLNSTGELSLKPEKLLLGEKEIKIIHRPFIISADEVYCNENKSFILANTGGKIPFSSDSYHLVIPVEDTLINELSISIENNDEVLFSIKTNESYIIPVGIIKCEENLAVTRDTANVAFKSFIVRNVNEKLPEGGAIIKIKNEERDISETYETQIVWFNKPFSLMQPENAIEFLSYVETDSAVYSLLNEDESNYAKILYDYWKKFDPTPETTYNEIMFEYYSRIDFAMKEFKGISKENGAKTDRGKIYIRNGKPESIKRSSNPQGQIVEIWTYLNPERKFSFVDKKGTGNFILIDEEQ